MLDCQDVTGLCHTRNALYVRLSGRDRFMSH